MLNIDKINVSYGELQVLWDVTLKVNDGEFVAIVGSNGVGKTTLLKTISGLLNPTAGKIELDGEQIDTVPARIILERGSVLVPEGRLLFPKMSVLENLEMGAYLPKSWSKRRETIEEVFELFPRLKERKSQKAGTLSGGEQQMLAIGRALMSHPSLLMLDEPSLGLAPKLVLKTFDIVRKLNEKGITILLVEQNIRLALQHAHRAYVLESGRVVLEGEQKELIDNEHVKKAYLGM